MDSTGGKAALSVMRLGKLRAQLNEVMIIEEIHDQEVRKYTEESLLEEAVETEEEEKWTAPALLDDDLVVGDCDSDDEVPCPPSSSSGRSTARRLMQARAQQCIVCMEEKEHTFVPPHVESNHSHTDGHRFCSDCWIDFLDHGLLVLRRGVSPAPLSCPICRSCIHVPDVWTVDVELPSVWTHAKPVEPEVQCHEVQVLSPTSDGERSAAELSWVSADSARSSDDCAPEGRHMLPPLCRRVWAAAVRSGAQYLRNVLGEAREAQGFVDLDAIHNS
ncbi:unnamed protein product [Effrenium voratum]|uniref:RING-type domain-containing protein n=1 Tax=Effrenium voratum TaxID=2562239 RepID=A0AA36NAW9_9DINO|nr:unnamed protein product [Effrenium voratum]|mmetsp:Transcript_87313/g.208864  ORF Transcript_87313/g.208864 Transcript_87313/m.208864 type:complete len:275 (+) Transcript_87313:101-925(+)